MTPIRTVLFDLGNVLVTFDPKHFWDRLNLHDESRQSEIGPRMLELGRIYESGSIRTDEFERRFRALFDGQYEDDTLREAFQSVLPEPIPGTENLVKCVSRNYDTALVSNTNPIHFELCLRTLPALRHMSRFYVSYEVGALKPAKEFYTFVENGERTSPASMVFIDDLEENVEGARSAGFRAVRFNGAEGLEEELRALKVI